MGDFLLFIVRDNAESKKLRYKPIKIPSLMNNTNTISSQALRMIVKHAFELSVDKDKEWTLLMPWLLMLTQDMKSDEKQDRSRILRESKARSMRDAVIVSVSDTGLCCADNNTQIPGNLRGRLQYCHNSYCDGINMVNDEYNMKFLTLATDTLLRTVLSTTHNQCR